MWKVVRCTEQMLYHCTIIAMSVVDLSQYYQSWNHPRHDSLGDVSKLANVSGNVT